MPAVKLTAKTIEAVRQPKSGRLELWDRLLPGFGLRVTENDARAWFIMYRSPTDGRQRRLKLGDARALDLGEARELAREAQRKIAKGIDPADEKAPARAANADSVKAVVASYLSRYVKKNTRPGTYKETKRVFEHDVLPAWGARPITSITRRNVGDLLETIIDRGAEVQANRTLARLKTFFRWAADEEIIVDSPVARKKPPTRETARDRALTDEEIGWFWAACEKIDWPFGPHFKLLLVTAQRRDEIGTLEFGELDLDKRLWTIPRGRAKNDRAHDVALSDAALEVIAGINETRGRIESLNNCPLVFTTTGKAPISGFSRAKARLDQEMERLARKARGLPEDDEQPRLIPDWILHDLRRTAATGMARLNVAPHVVDKVLNHVSGTIRGVAAVYNRFEYAEERKSALEAWGRYVTALVRPGQDNVVQLASRG
jgi:integrase